MIKSIIYNIIFLTIIFSCSNKVQEQNKKKIIGDWNFSKVEEIIKTPRNEEEPPSPFSILQGYIFEKDSLCINKSGYFDFLRSDVINKSSILYSGNKTKYYIDGDSLKIYNLISKKWNNAKIVSITKDSLFLQAKENEIAKYYKPIYQIDKNESYDKIVVSSSGCFGSCAISSLSLDKNGQVIFFGDSFNSVNGLFEGKTSIENFKKIEYSFKKANIKKLESAYSAKHTDDNTITITFVKNNKIIKTISDYGSVSPPELVAAYRNLQYLYQIIKLKKLINLYNFPPNITGFSVNENFYHLEKSEGFYLFTELISAKETDKPFKNKFSIDNYSIDDEFNYGNSIKILTDGKCFKINNKTYDIGFNFYEINNFENRKNSLK